MSNLKRATGTSAKVRHGAGWGGKGSAHPTSERGKDIWGRKVPGRFYQAYASKRGRGGKRWHQRMGTAA